MLTLMLPIGSKCNTVAISWSSQSSYLNDLLDLLDFITLSAYGYRLLPQLCLLSACLSWILRLKDLVQLFQRAAFSLNEEKIDDNKFKKIPANKENIEPILDLRMRQRKSSKRPVATYIFQSDRSREGVDETGTSRRKLEHTHTLGSHIV